MGFLGLKFGAKKDAPAAETLAAVSAEPVAIQRSSGALTDEEAGIIMLLNEITRDVLPGYEWHRFGVTWKPNYQLIARPERGESVQSRWKRGILHDSAFEALQRALNFPSIAREDYAKAVPTDMTMYVSEEPVFMLFDPAINGSDPGAPDPLPQKPVMRLAFVSDERHFMIEGGTPIESPDGKAHKFLAQTANLPHLKQYLEYYKAAVKFQFGLGPEPYIATEETAPEVIEAGAAVLAPA